PPARRGALRREGRAREHPQGPAEPEAPRPPPRAEARLEEGDRPAPRGRHDRDLRRGASLMALRKYKPTSPGRRFMSVSAFDDVTKSEPEKNLLAPLKKSGGRNTYGRITRRHQGGGHKRRYRVIDFKRLKDGVPAKVVALEYEPTRAARAGHMHAAQVAMGGVVSR